MPFWISLATAMASGVLMAVQGTLNSLLSKTIGLIETTLVVHITGSIMIGIIFLAVRMGKSDLSTFWKAPWYAYLGGIIGVVIIYLVAASIPKVGAANATTAIIVGQVLTALIIDNFGLLGLHEAKFSMYQGIGLALLAVGAKLLLRH